MVASTNMATNMATNMDIDWILTDTLRVTKQDSSWLVHSLSTPYRTNVTLSYDANGRMLFNGVDIETEDFMAFVGLLDEVTDKMVDGTNPVMIKAAEC